MLTNTYHELGLPNVDPVDEEAKGSTDVGAASYKCPTIQGNIKIASDDVLGHSKEMAAATISEDGKNGLIKQVRQLLWLLWSYWKIQIN